jgi:DNA-directed RNA polymerase specialized sigma24 family protein
MAGSVRTIPRTRKPGGTLSIQPPESIEKSDGGTGSEHEERLKADGELFDSLMLQGFDGPDWEKFRRALAEYAVRVLRSWIRSGRIAQECARQKCPCMPLTARARSREESQDLATDTVAEALCFFRDEVLGKGQWDRTKGASLRTFFMGACLFCFRNVYRDWRRLQRRMASANPNPTDDTCHHIEDERADRNPERRVINAFTAREVLTDVDEVTREMLALDADGESYAEIGRRFGKTAHAVESRLYRLRARKT